MRFEMHLAAALAFALIPCAGRAQPALTDRFPIEDCHFRSRGGNDFFRLEPGRALRYSNERCVAAGACEELVELEVSVLPETRRVSFELDGEFLTVKTRVVEEVETVEGELAEVSRNFVADCRGTGDVYYFGEEVDIFEDDGSVSHAGTWLAGANGALPGLLFPGGAFLLGARYFQELAPGVALDRAEHVALGLTLELPAGPFENCVRVEETTELEPGSVSAKLYCPEVGLAVDGDLELVEIVGDDDDD
jgi:hypothetical protein